ncbi:MAG: SAM-dependent methyltransferase [Nocardiopsaceae bacterium]|nr:SAM-dependent methyltransferase [Nocardiopsaceae bacterium]
MTDDIPAPHQDATALPEIDTTVPHSARVWNYWLGGKDNYAVDREVGDQVLEMFPAMPTIARQGRAFLVRAVTYLAGQAGIRQFLDIGTGMPTHNNTHEVAQSVAPESRIVYVDNDPLVLAHANALLVGTPEGTTDYIHADLREPEAVIEAARTRLDFTQPIGLMLMGVLGHLPGDEPHRIVRRLVEALPAGSCLAQWDGTDTDPAGNEAMRWYNETAPLPYHPRSPGEIASFYDGLEVVEPGIVPCPQWRPEPTDIGVSGGPDKSETCCGVGRKPDASARAH